MSLEDELRESTAFDLAGARNKIGTVQDRDDPFQAIEFLMTEVLLPILGQYREAILRLAREVDDLRGEAAKPEGE